MDAGRVSHVPSGRGIHGLFDLAGDKEKMNLRDLDTFYAERIRTG
jgi:hypothetical protein